MDSAQAEEAALRRNRQQQTEWRRSSGEVASGSGDGVGGASWHGAESRGVTPECFKKRDIEKRQKREAKKAEAPTRSPEAEQEFQRLLASFRSG